jgi:hypothetical protein
MYASMHLDSLGLELFVDLLRRPFDGCHTSGLYPTSVP